MWPCARSIPMISTMIREGSVVRIKVRVGLKFGRVGVVLRIRQQTGDLFVAWGTGTGRAHLPHILVTPRETAGVSLGLTRPTYFYGHNHWAGDPMNVDIQRGLCPTFLLAELRDLVESRM